MNNVQPGPLILRKVKVNASLARLDLTLNLELHIVLLVVMDTHLVLILLRAHLVRQGNILHWAVHVCYVLQDLGVQRALRHVLPATQELSLSMERVRVYLATLHDGQG